MVHKTQAGIWLATEVCRDNLQKIEDSHILDDDLGSQEWLDQYLTGLGLDVSETLFEAGDSEEEEETPESQITEDNIKASIHYGVNLSLKTLQEDGIGEYSQALIQEFKEQLKSTQQTNTKLRVCFERVKRALAATKEILLRKNNEIEELSKMHKEQRDDLESRLASSLRVCQMTMERTCEAEQALKSYRQLFTQLGEAFNKNDPFRLSENLTC
ncbi:hypothetical protein AAF712_014364 [Marasmius tenuissimus]|uniref:Uncharacterized protein n=1 Tax=Marasmius tenuissimus TaxID=585030 RepID=A0ABR2ZDE1_9AGAR